MDTIVVALVLAVILGGAVYYVYKEKKSGTVCIGCPHAKTCSKKSCDKAGEVNRNDEI